MRNSHPLVGKEGKFVQRAGYQSKVRGGFEVRMGHLIRSIGTGFAASAKNGSYFLPFHQGGSNHVNGSGIAVRVTVINRHSNESKKLYADVIINAGWRLGGKCAQRLEPASRLHPRCNVAFEKRLSNLVLNRLAIPVLAISSPSAACPSLAPHPLKCRCDYIPVDQNQITAMLDVRWK